jgi:uncharacterized membrane protein SpoIIM required for sporulation
MRFPKAAIMFMIGAFVFFLMFAVSSRIINEVDTALTPFDSGYDSTYQDIKNNIPTAFGLIVLILFVVGVIVAFFVDALGEEYEYYPRRRG